MLAIRLRRAGAKKNPLFRIVVTEHSSARDGRFVEIIGNYNPRTSPETLVVDRERLNHWIGVGARPSDTVRTLVDRMPPPDAGAPETAAAEAIAAATPEPTPAVPAAEAPEVVTEADTEAEAAEAKAPASADDSEAPSS